MLMDEVITGYRWSSGGAQKAFGITPDLCIQAKIVAGGLPGGAVAGKRDILDRIDHDATAAKKIERILHPGTYNANPLSAAAAVTALTLLRERAQHNTLADDYGLRNLLGELLCILHPDALHLLDPWPRHADETPSFAAIAHGLTQVIATQRALVQLTTHSSSTATP